MTKNILVGVALCAMAASTASAEVQFAIADGRVTLVARNATVRQILEEWRRVGGTTFVNAERIPGGAVSIELKNTPERTALDVVLRAASGYMASPRVSPSGSQSQYERVLVLPTSAPPPPPANAPGRAQPSPAQIPRMDPAAQQQLRFLQQQFSEPAIEDDDMAFEDGIAPPAFPQPPTNVPPAFVTPGTVNPGIVQPGAPVIIQNGAGFSSEVPPTAFGVTGQVPTVAVPPGGVPPSFGGQAGAIAPVPVQQVPRQPTVPPQFPPQQPR